MWAILASPLVVTTPILNCSRTDQINGKYTPGACVPSMTSLQKEILLNKEVLAINQDVSPAGHLLWSPAQRVQAADCALVNQLSAMGPQAFAAMWRMEKHSMFVLAMHQNPQLRS